MGVRDESYGNVEFNIPEATVSQNYKYILGLS